MTETCKKETIWWWECHYERNATLLQIQIFMLTFYFHFISYSCFVLYSWHPWKFLGNIYVTIMHSIIYIDTYVDNDSGSQFQSLAEYACVSFSYLPVGLTFVSSKVFSDSVWTK